MFDLTIGITSFNRLLYLKPLLHGLDCVDREKIQFIVVDNCSTEEGLLSFLEDQKENNKIHLLFLRGKTEKRNWVNDEYIAKNIIIKNANSDIILFLQDDLQFLTNQESLLSTVETFRKTNIPCCELLAVRKSTIESNNSGHHFCDENGIRFWKSNNNHFHTMGLFRKDIFDKFGLYPTDWPQTQEFWGRSEDWYDYLLKSKMPNRQLNISCWAPHFAGVWNDPRGGYSFIRGNKRYGHYIPAIDNKYYHKMSPDTYKEIQNVANVPLSFVDMCIPNQWDIQIDQNGDQIKYPQSKVMIDGPVSDF